MSAKPSSDGAVRHYGKLAKVGLVWGVVRQAGSSALLLPTSMALARLLTPAEAGVAAAAYFFMQLGARLTQFGFGVALVRVKELRPDHTSSVFVLNLTMGLLACLTLSLAAPAVGRFFDSPEAGRLLPVASLGYLVMAFGTVPTALLSRDMRYRDSTTSEWLGTVTDAAVSVGLAWLGFSYWSIVYGHLAGDSARGLSRAVAARWLPSLRVSRSAMREMFSFGSGIYARNVLEYCAQNLDNLIVGRLLGVTALGFYDKAFSTMSRLMSRINLAGPSVSFRVFALIHEDRERFRRGYRKVILTVTLVGYPILSGLIVAGPEVIEVLFGPRWLPAVEPFQVLCGAGMFRLLNTYASSATQAKGQIWSEVRRQVLFVAVLILAVGVGTTWGIVGAAWGVFGATVVMSGLLHRLVRRLTGLRWQDMLMPQVPGSVAALGVALSVSGVRLAVIRWYPGTNVFILLVLCIAAAVLMYLAFLRFSRFGEVRALIRETIEDLSPRYRQRMMWLDDAGATGAQR